MNCETCKNYEPKEQKVPKQAFKVGDLVATVSNNLHGVITEIQEEEVDNTGSNVLVIGINNNSVWTSLKNLRGLTSEEALRFDNDRWTTVLPGGVMVRAYYHNSGVSIRTESGSCFLWFLDEGEAICSAAGIKIKTIAENEEPLYPMPKE